MTAVAIVGAGRLGTVLAAALRKKGFEIRGIADRSARDARESRRIIGAGVPTTACRKAAADAEIIFLTVPDGAIERTARELAAAQTEWRGKTVFHTSGLHAASILAPLRALGAACASFHPVQSFPRKDLPASRFKNIFIGIEGDEGALSAAEAIAHKLGARPFRLGSGDKALYHAACSLASNLLVPLFETACALMRAAGVGPLKAEEILLPLAEGTLQSVKHFDGAKALTGPIARGDVETVRRHLQALDKYPDVRKIYQTLGREALRLVRTSRTVPAAAVKALGRLLGGR
jgi:predicted short-subunit dehydrogenase-like oxidoreductase (DUF2520 family)